MFKTCIYCNRKLGSNESIESFPVGRRLAFDQAKGRLWVICELCRRWNLTPLEERWEAIEECERHFHDTPQRFSTDNIGLARLHEGLELVRVGRPERREFAAWRYGREFLRRRIRSLILTGAKVAVSVAGALLGADVFWVFIAGGKRGVVARVRDEAGRRLYVTRKGLTRVELARAEAPDGWSLTLPYHAAERIGLLGWRGKGRVRHAVLTGPVAIRAAGRLLPRVNSWGGTDAQVRAAVALIEESRRPERLFARVAGDPDAVRSAGRVDARSVFLKKMDANVRLALEMAAHEESERRALEGELAGLEQAWREAEEIAAIADRLLIPDRIEGWIRSYKEKLARGRSR
jgi:hypothetical protein